MGVTVYSNIGLRPERCLFYDALLTRCNGHLGPWMEGDSVSEAWPLSRSFCSGPRLEPRQKEIPCFRDSETDHGPICILGTLSLGSGLLTFRMQPACT